ncbi:MAG: YbjN domain-containing protein [Anaerolineae bacterium]|nr:YbjN domain-containing protein [Anaerolineae bacterium]
MNIFSKFFESRGLAFEEIDTCGISSAFSTDLPDGQEQAFNLFVLLIEDEMDKYVRFTVVPFVEQPYEGYPPDLYAAIGRRNHSLPQLKFAFDDDDDLELAVDIPEAQLDQREFDRIVQLLVDYASSYYLEIEALIQG